MRGGAWQPRNLSFESSALDAPYLSILMQIGPPFTAPTEARDERPPSRRLSQDTCQPACKAAHA